MRDYAEPMTVGQLKSCVDRIHELLAEPKYSDGVWHSMVGDAMRHLVEGWAGQQPIPKSLADEECEQGRANTFESYEALRCEYQTAEMFLNSFSFERHIPILYPVVVELLVRFTRAQNQRLEAMSKAIGEMVIFAMPPSINLLDPSMRNPKG